MPFGLQIVPPEVNGKAFCLPLFTGASFISELAGTFPEDHSVFLHILSSFLLRIF